MPQCRPRTSGQVAAKLARYVALVILQIEWMTQRHYLESIRDDQDLDPQFRSLLRHHWMEEAQHAKLDTLMIEAISQACCAEEVGATIDDYVKIAKLLDHGLQQQVKFSIAAFQRATARVLSDDERNQVMEAFEDLTALLLGFAAHGGHGVLLRRTRLSTCSLDCTASDSLDT